MDNPTKKTESDVDTNQDFYEAIPYTALPHSAYSDDLDNYPDKYADSDANKRTAIITLILLAVVVVAFALLIIWGVSILGTNGAPSTSETLLNL